MSEFNESNVLEIAEMLKTATENVERVYAAGHSEGMKSEYDAFWDDYQDNGNRRDYTCAFGGQGWTKEQFNPKYPLIITNGYMLFYRNPNAIDSVAADFTNCTDLSYTFGQCGVAKVGTVDARKAVNLNGTFGNSKNLVSVEKVILTDNGNQQFISGAFKNCTALENITFEGVIGQDLDIQWSTKLKRASIESIVNHLSDAAIGKTLTLSEAAVDTAFSGGQSAPDPSTTTEIGSATVDWFNLYLSKTNWTITLV